MASNKKIDFTANPENSFLYELQPTALMGDDFRQFEIINDIHSKLGENFNGFVVCLVTFAYLRITGTSAHDKLVIPVNATFDTLTYNAGRNFFVDIFNRYKIICEANEALEGTAAILEPSFMAGANKLSSEFQKNFASELLELDWSETGFSNHACGVYVERDLIRFSLAYCTNDTAYPDYYIHLHHLAPLLKIRPDDKLLCTPILYNTYLVRILEKSGWPVNACEKLVNKYLGNVTAVQTDSVLWAIHALEVVLLGCKKQLISKPEALSTAYNNTDGKFDAIFLPEADNNSVPNIGPITVGNIGFEKMDEDGNSSNSLYYVAFLYNMLNDQGRMLVRFDEKYETALRPECSIDGIYDQGLCKFFVENNLIEAVIQTKNCTYMLIDKNRPETKHDKILFYYGQRFGEFVFGQYSADNEKLTSCIKEYSCDNIQIKHDEGACFVSRKVIRLNDYCLFPKKYIYDSRTPKQVARPLREQHTIKAITIENFKGISQPVRIEFKPITLLFGANSCGKSSIIQALHYVREVLEFRRLDVDKTTAGGDFIDLGGFDNIIHGHDTERKLRFKIEMNKISEDYFKDLNLLNEDDPDGEEFYNKLYDDGNKYLDITIAKHGENIIVEQINIVINSVISLSIMTNNNHLEAIGIFGEVPDRTHFNNIDEIIALRPLSAQLFDENPFHFFSINDGIIESNDKRGVLNFLLYFLNQQTLLPNVSKYIQEPIKRNWEYNDYVSAAFETALFGMIGTIVEDLNSMLYLGPLREIPPRNYLPLKIPHLSRWANGLAAWDEASDANQEKIDELNYWMGKKGLDTGYQLQSNYFYRIPVNTIKNAKNIKILFESLPEQEGKVDLVQESNGLKVSLTDVGVGISQVFPVIVAALKDDSKLTMLEQPELHIHPRLQVELGDLFIKAIQKDKCMIIETHSEHLLLRIMKRMRKHETSLENKSDLAVQDNSESGITPEDVGVWLFEQYNGRTIAREMALNRHGEFVKSWPGGFFEEGLRETI